VITCHRKSEGRKNFLGWKHETRNLANNIKLTADFQIAVAYSDYENNNDSGFMSYV
jgi:hypothetical protein